MKQVNEIDDGGAAFPVPDQRDPVTGAGIMQGSPGLSRRDYFAAAALPALIARHRADVPWRQVAPLAFEMADALIAASKSSEPGHE